MSSETELRIIIKPTHVERISLRAVDDEGELVGLEMYKELLEEIQRFTRCANQILKDSQLLFYL